MLNFLIGLTRTATVNSRCAYMSSAELAELICEYELFRRSGVTNWNAKDPELQAYWLFTRWFTVQSQGRHHEAQELLHKILSYPDDHLVRLLHGFTGDGLLSIDECGYKEAALKAKFPELWLHFYYWFSGALAEMRMNDTLAVPKYKEMIAIGTNLESRVLIGFGLWLLQPVYFRLGRFGEMFQVIDQLEALASEAKFAFLLAEVHIGRAQYFYFVGDFPRASRSASLALRHTTKEPRSFRVDRILYLKAQIELAMGKFDDFTRSMNRLHENCRFSQRSEEDMSMHYIFHNRMRFQLVTHQLTQFHKTDSQFPTNCLDPGCEWTLKFNRIQAELLNPHPNVHFIDRTTIDDIISKLESIKDTHVEAPIWYFELKVKKGLWTKEEDQQLKRFLARAEFRQFPHVGLELKFLEFCQKVQAGGRFEESLLGLIRFCRNWMLEFEQAKYLWYWRLLFNEGLVGNLPKEDRLDQRRLFTKFEKYLKRFEIVWPFSALLKKPKTIKIEANDTLQTPHGKIRELARLLVKNKGQVVRYEDLVKELWDEEYERARHSGRIHVLVQRLRRHLLQKYGHKFLVEVVKEEGYVLGSAKPIVKHQRRSNFIENWINEKPIGKILTSRDLMRTFSYSERQAQRILHSLALKGKLEPQGMRKNRKYKIIS